MRARVDALVAGVAVAAWTACFRSYGVFDFADEGTLLMQGLRAAHGERPYTDFATGYGPLYFLLLGPLVAQGGLPTVRLALVALHGVTAAALFAAARRLAGRGGATLAVLVLVAFFLPVAPGRGAPFLVPYPAWVVAALALGCMLLLDRSAGGMTRWRSALAGALAGAALGFKPNAGLLLLAGSAATVARGDVDDRRAGPLGAAVFASLVVGVLLLVRPVATTVLWWTLVPPVVALAAAGMRHCRPDEEIAPHLLAIGLGFVIVAVPSFAPALLRLGPAAFAREALLLGAGVAEVYAVPVPPAALLVALGAGIAWAGARRLGLGLAGAGLVIGGVMAMAEASRPTAGLRLAGEGVLMVAVPLVLWGGLGAAARTTAAGVAASTLAMASAVLLYPRPDFLHLATIAPALLPTAAWLVQAAASRNTKLIAGRSAVGVALAIVALGRLAPTLGTAMALLGGHMEEVSIGRVVLRAEPEGLARLRALADAVQSVATRTEPTTRVATFPACAMVPFLAGRLGAGPHDYFFPGRPSRAEGAALAAAWSVAPPPLAVTCDATGTDLARAWSAYPELVALFETRYRPLAVAGPFVVRERAS